MFAWKTYNPVMDRHPVQGVSLHLAQDTGIGSSITTILYIRPDLQYIAWYSNWPMAKPHPQTQWSNHSEQL